MRKPTSKFFRPTVETLTDRVLPSVSLDAGDLVITGRDYDLNARGSADDTVTVSWTVRPTSGRGGVGGLESVYRVVEDRGENDIVTDFPTGQVTGRVVFNGLGGN